MLSQSKVQELIDQALDERLRIDAHVTEARAALARRDFAGVAAALERSLFLSMRSLDVQRFFDELLSSEQPLAALQLLSRAQHVLPEHMARVHAQLTRSSANASSDSADERPPAKKARVETPSAKKRSPAKKQIPAKKSAAAQKSEPPKKKVAEKQSASTKPVAAAPSKRIMAAFERYVDELFEVDATLSYEESFGLEDIYQNFCDWCDTKTIHAPKKSTFLRCITAFDATHHVVAKAAHSKAVAFRRLKLRQKPGLSSSSDEQEGDDDDEEEGAEAAAEQDDENEEERPVGGVRVVREAPCERPLLEPMSEAEMLQRDTGAYQFDEVVRPDDEIVFADDADSLDVAEALVAGVRLPTRDRGGSSSSSDADDSTPPRPRKRKSNPFIDDEAADSGE